MEERERESVCGQGYCCEHESKQAACGCGQPEHEHEHEHNHCHEHEHEHEHHHGNEHNHEHHHDHGHDHGCGCGACCGCCDHGHGDEEGGAGTWIRIGIAAALFIAGLLTRSLPTVSLILFALSTLVSAGPVFVGAIRELRHTLFGEQTLLMIAVLAAFAIGEGLEGAAVAVLFAIGEELEEYAARRSYNAIRTLSDLRPDTAWKRDENGELQEVPAESVEAGDLLELLPHRRIAVDCEVVSGEGTVDLSALTGESAPVSAVPGTALLSGGMNGNETLTVRALRPATESAAARILSLVTDASARKGSAEKFITRFARIYTPAVTGAAVLLAVVPSLFGWLPWTESIHRALTFLVASCPCALVISIPLGFTAGMGAASKRGVLIKGGRFLEELAKLQAVALDKTGTLTTGRSEVRELYTAEGVSRQEALSLACALEKDSEHPLAAAIVACAEAEGAAPVAVQDCREIPARGVEAVHDGHRVRCGGARMFAEEPAERGTLPDGDILLAVDDRIAAVFSVSSEVRPESARTVQELQELGVREVAMLTGDRAEAAQETAGRVGIRSVFAGLLPEDKEQHLHTLREQYGTTAFVGDGINDAPCLAAADVGIAMGLGSAAAIETGDVVLMGSDLSKLPEAIQLSRRVMRTVRQNIVFALAVKAAVLILAAFGLAPMWAAVFADVGVSCLCVLHSSALLLTKSAKKSTV